MWILDELDKRDWTPAILSKKAEINPGSLSHILNGSRKPGPDVCTSIANALGVSPETVFRAAGLLPKLPPEDASFREILEAVRPMSVEEREEILEYVLWKQQRKKSQPTERIEY